MAEYTGPERRVNLGFGPPRNHHSLLPDFPDRQMKIPKEDYDFGTRIHSLLRSRHAETRELAEMFAEALLNGDGSARQQVDIHNATAGDFEMAVVDWTMTRLDVELRILEHMPAPAPYPPMRQELVMDLVQAHRSRHRDVG